MDCVLIPAKDESKRIQDVINRIDKTIIDVVVVDDGSKDNTSQIAKDCGAVVLRHKINLGKGIALRTGCEYAIRKGYKKIVFLDADGQHPPELIPKFLGALDEADLIFGCREFRAIPLILRLGNWGLSFAIRILYGINIPDTQCGYRAINSKIYDKIKWESSGYEVESEMIINTAKAKVLNSSLKIDTIYKDKYKGTIILDGLKIGFNLIKWKLKKR